MRHACTWWAMCVMSWLIDITFFSKRDVRCLCLLLGWLIALSVLYLFTCFCTPAVNRTKFAIASEFPLTLKLFWHQGCQSEWSFLLVDASKVLWHDEVVNPIPLRTRKYCAAEEEREANCNKNSRGPCFKSCKTATCWPNSSNLPPKFHPRTGLKFFGFFTTHQSTSKLHVNAW